MVLEYEEMKKLKERRKRRHKVDRKMKCKFCGYEWLAKVDYPVSCPRCKQRFDHVSKVQTTKASSNSSQN